MTSPVTDLLHKSGTLSSGADAVVLEPATAGWTYSGLRVLTLGAGESRTVSTAGFEAAVLPLSGACDVGADGENFALNGRPSVFSHVTDFAYVGCDTEMVLHSANGCELALCTAQTAVKRAPKYGPVDGVQVEVRGGGQATRQINNFMSPETWDHADKLMCVEVLTPEGNWSSYPPHKHDASPECEVNNEEIYYFRIGQTGSVECSPIGFGMHRTYTGEGDPGEAFEVNTNVYDGDVFLVPRGYHGPCIAAPGYHMYYLNVLAGPGGERSMAFCDDPAHHWVRDELSRRPLDPRCPLTTPNGPTHLPADR